MSRFPKQRPIVPLDYRSVPRWEGDASWGAPVAPPTWRQRVAAPLRYAAAKVRRVLREIAA